MFPKPKSVLVPNTYAYESEPMVKPTGFREYDARWLFGKEINLMGVQALGVGLGTLIHEMGVKPQIVTAHDFRSYSASIKMALATGLMAAGCKVHDIGLAVVIDVSDDNVVGAGCIFIEDISFELLLARFAGVAIPNAAANKVNPAVAIHIHWRKADVGQIIRADEVLHPSIRRSKFEPVKLTRLRGASPEDEIETAVTIHVHQGRQPVVPDVLVRDRQLATDKMVTELEIRREHCALAGNGDAQKRQHGKDSVSHDPECQAAHSR